MSRPSTRALVRYGTIAEVVRAAWLLDEVPQRGMQVVLRTPRGEQPGHVLHDKRPLKSHTPSDDEHEPGFSVVRIMTDADHDTAREAGDRAAREYSEWSDRIADWGLSLQLLDCERTLDGGAIILYVAGGRGSETTRLALNAVGCGAQDVVVQPVDHTGPVPVETGGGCGTGGCGCGD